MTVVVGVAAPDGLILAADSRSTMIEGTRHRVVTDNAQKVFPICGCAVATYGLSFLGDRTIAGVMHEFVAELGDDRPEHAEQLADRLAAYADERFAQIVPEEARAEIAEQGHLLGFLVAGYDEDGVGRLREVAIPGGAVTVDLVDGSQISTATTGVLWRGETDAIRRLILGVDWDAG